MTLTAGSKLGPYEVLAPSGAGGMGEVYRAKDPRLGREVAIKVLPASFSQDADRLKRFEQEARAAGVLNHPNITAVYDLGSHDGAPYIVTELLEGETLRSRLSAGALPVRKAIEYADPDRAGTRRGAREGDRAPGPEAGEPVPDEGRAGQDPGLRSGEAEERERRGAADRPEDDLGHGAGRRARNHGLHGAGAGARESPRTGARISSRSARSSTRCSRGSGRSGATRRPTRSRRSCTKEPPDLSQTNKDVPPGDRADRAALPREEPGGALRVGARRRVRPGVALERLRDPQDRRGAPLPRRPPAADCAGLWPRSPS